MATGHLRLGVNPVTVPPGVAGAEERTIHPKTASTVSPKDNPHAPQRPLQNHQAPATECLPGHAAAGSPSRPLSRLLPLPAPPSAAAPLSPALARRDHPLPVPALAALPRPAVARARPAAACVRPSAAAPAHPPGPRLAAPLARLPAQDLALPAPPQTASAVGRVALPKAARASVPAGPPALAPLAAALAWAHPPALGLASAPADRAAPSKVDPRRARCLRQAAMAPERLATASPRRHHP